VLGSCVVTRPLNPFPEPALSPRLVDTPRVEYAERGKYGILFLCSLFCDYFNLEYVRLHLIYRVVAAPQECMTYLLSS